jgi:hypothetical protein
VLFFKQLELRSRSLRKAAGLKNTFARRRSGCSPGETVCCVFEMGDFYEAVSALLDAFARGVAVIRAQRSRRKKEQMSIDSAQKIAEKSLSSSLRKNRAEINQAYGRDLKRFGKSCS